MQQNSNMVFFLLFENKVDLDLFQIFVTYNSFALKCPFDFWRKTIVSALKIGVCKQW